MHFCPSSTLRLHALGVYPDSLSKFLDCQASSNPRLSSFIDEDSGCPDCQSTIEAIEQQSPGWTRNNIDEKRIGVDKQSNDLVMYQGMDLKIVGHFPVQYNPTTSELRQGVSRDQDAAIKTARSWLEDCEKHERCEPGTSGPLPRRLLDVGKNESTKITLVEVDKTQPEKFAKFACLSYRWGTKKEEILRTTSDNIKQHFKSIVLKDLPQTIIDTVEVCKELNIPYLWVDSLCIIQPRDNETLKSDKVAREDWEQEGSTMQNAYGSSYLTIYAESASSCKAGFLRDCKFGCASNKFDHDNEQFDDSDNEYTRPYKIDASGTVLRLRGWCLQEYLVPNRRLRFYEAEMVWECNEHSRCQCNHIRSGRRRLDHIKPISLPPQQKPHSGSFDHVTEWWKIVEDYSWRSVSSPEINKLMGLSGVANVLLEASKGTSRGQDEYLAGLWGSELLKGLAWMTLETSQRHKRLNGSAPTWSWASIDGPITFGIRPSFAVSSSHKVVKTPNAKLVNYKLTEESPSTPKGYITLKGLLAPVQLASLDKRLSLEWRDQRGDSDRDLRPVTLIRSKSMESHAVFLDYDDVDGVIELNDMACWKEKKCICGPGIKSCFSDAKGFFALRLHTWEDKPSSTNTVRRRRPGSPLRRSLLDPEVWFLVLKMLDSEYYERIGIGHYISDSCTKMWAQSKRDGPQEKQIRVI